MAERKNIINKAYLVFLAVCFFSLFVLGKIVMIQFIEGDKWEAKVEKLTTDLREITPVRGNVYTTDGNMLSTSVPIYEIRMDMECEGFDEEAFDEEIDSLSFRLSQLFGNKTAAQFKNDLLDAQKAGNRYYRVKSKVEHDERQQAEKFPFFRRGRLKSGVIFEKNTVRKHPFGSLAARTVGYERDGVRPVGIEGAYDAELRGVPGSRYEKRLAGGTWMPIDNTNEVEPQDGYDVYTTIDINIQDVAESALRKQLKKHRAHHGCAVLMEVKTGRIKAIANLTLSKDSTYREVYNYAVGEATEPGSTFKLPALMAALEDGLLELTDSINTKNGKHKFYDRTMRDSNDKGFGKIDVVTAFQKSSNVAISRLIFDRYKDNPREFVDRLFKMGLGRPLGVEIAGEGEPKIKDPSDPTWSGTTLPWMSIGYETLMTPLQILTFYNAVANDGKMVKPAFVKDLRRNGKVLKTFEPVVINSSIASHETLRKARLILETVVSAEGTASNLRFGAYSIAGKTGTAQIANAQYGYKYQEAVSYQASFVGYFPADKPEYTCIVVVNGPSNNVYYGNQVAGPVFKEIADKVFAGRLDLHDLNEQEPALLAVKIPVSKSGQREDLDFIFNEFNVPVNDEANGYAWVTTHTGTDTVTVERRTIPKDRVPNVVGMGLRDGLFLLEKAGLDVRVKGKGMISKQSIPPGTNLSRYESIQIELS
ncbi:MAG: cell division protein FtsI (penicillin-binding protein 3) [Cryomorphaceae bacterium]|jgi:cell division protein FtsI (penicillin-binding protein 3)